MTINTASVNPYLSTQKQHSSSQEKYSSSQENTISLTSLSYNEIKNIMPKKEEYHNISDILEKMSKIATSPEYRAYTFSSNFTNNDTINSAMYETLKNMSMNEQICFTFEIEQEMANYKNGFNLKNSFYAELEGDNFNSHELLTKKERTNIDFSDFLVNMQEVLMELVSEAKHPKIKQQFEESLQMYENLSHNYNQAKSEPIYA